MVKRHGGGLSDVKRFFLAEHGNFEGFIAFGEDFRLDTLDLAADYEGYLAGWLVIWQFNGIWRLLKRADLVIMPLQLCYNFVDISVRAERFFGSQRGFGNMIVDFARQVRQAIVYRLLRIGRITGQVDLIDAQTVGGAQ